MQNLQATIAEHLKGLRTGHFVNEVPPDKELRLAGRKRADGVSVPNFVEQITAVSHGGDQVSVIEGMSFLSSRYRRARILSEHRAGLHPNVFVSRDAKTGRLFRFRSISTIRRLFEGGG
jgi:hypothetical protein